MPELQSRFCALCGPEADKHEKFPSTFSLEDLNAKIYSARRRPDRVHFRLMECARCRMIFSDPVADPSVLAALYQKSTVTYGDQQLQIFESYQPALQETLKYISHRGTFLEIGGGAGFMLRFGEENEFQNLIEIEPSEDARVRFQSRHPGARFIREMFQPGLLPEKSVSLVCFFQALDHIPDPRAFLAEVYTVLEPGGCALCITHDTQAFSARLFGERSPIYDVEHTYLFNTENLSGLFENLGFHVRAARPFPNRYAASYWAHLLPLPRFLKHFLQWGLKVTGLGRWKINLYAGNLVVIAQKPV